MFKLLKNKKILAAIIGSILAITLILLANNVEQKSETTLAPEVTFDFGEYQY